MRGRREEGSALSPLLWGVAIWAWFDEFFDVFGAGSAWWVGPWRLVGGEEASVFPVGCALGLVGPSPSWFCGAGLAGGPVVWVSRVVGLRTDTGVQRGGSPPHGPLPACISGVSLDASSPCSSAAHFISSLSFELLAGHVTWVVPLAWDVGISSVSEFPGWCCAFLVAVSLTMGVAFSLGGRAGLLVGPFAGGVYSCWILEGAG